MKKSLYCLTILAIIVLLMPLFSHNTNVLHAQNSASYSYTDQENDLLTFDSMCRDESAFASLVFTETPTTRNGFYYICRQGANVLARFGCSSIMYQYGDTYLILDLLGSNSIIPQVEKPCQSITNYFLGNDQANWKTNLVDYYVLAYYEIYPGIDLIYKIEEGSLRSQFIVHTNANPEAIQMNFKNVDVSDISDNYVKLVQNNGFQLDLMMSVFQSENKDGKVEGIFSTNENDDIGFFLSRFEPAHETVIDFFSIQYSSFYGGSNYDTPYDIAADENYIYIVGSTSSTNLTLVNPTDSTLDGGGDIYIAKFTRDGKSLVYSSYMGGSESDAGKGITLVDDSIYITGSTASPNFPTISAYDSSINGNSDCFVAKLDAGAMTLIYSTYLGGNGLDSGSDIEVENGYAFVIGDTLSSNFPVVNAFDDTMNNSDSFLTKLSVNGKVLNFSTLIGGSGMEDIYDITVVDGTVYVVGRTHSPDFPTLNAYDTSFNGDSDCFLMRIASDDGTLNSSTYLGGTGAESGWGLVVENGFVYVTGFAGSSNFPMVNPVQSYLGGAWDCFLTIFAPSCQSLVYSTLLGGESTEIGRGIAVKDGYVYIVGDTHSPDFPVVNAYMTTMNGSSDCFVSMFAKDGQSLIYSTFLGGSTMEQINAVTINGWNLILAGSTSSSDFPVMNAFDSTHNGKSDTFLMILSIDPNNPQLLDAPGNLQYEEGVIEHLLRWSFFDLFPDSFVSYINNSIKESGSWNGSDIYVDVGGLSAGIYNVSLFVNDTSGQSVSASVYINVTESIVTTTETTVPTTTSTTSTPSTPTSTTTTTNASEIWWNPQVVSFPIVITVGSFAVILIVFALICRSRRYNQSASTYRIG